jgi:hypothetical protein
MNTAPSPVESVDADHQALPPCDTSALAAHTNRRVRPGLPPALLLVLTPIRKRLASREFWLSAIVVVWAIASIAIG